MQLTLNESTQRIRRFAQITALIALAWVIVFPSAVEAARPADIIQEAARGSRAINLLQDKLPNVARVHKMSAGELRVRFRRDGTLWVDRSGRLFHVEPTVQGGATASSAEPWLESSSIPPSDAFTLHSRPGASRQIYLDFDGHTASGTAWAGGATVNAPPFDTDGNPSSFSDDERNRIIATWRRVAEDYAPFNVDVTTVQPSALSGTRVVITHTDSRLCTSCGGVAYVGVFNGSSYYQPAWVFYDGLSSSPKYMAEAISHEAGHNLGLSHDGTSSASYYSGQDDWAPIMGVGYYVNLSQWSKGEYLSASNTQDDIAIIAGYIPLIGDDYGNTLASATLLNSSGSFGAFGLINSRTDVDVFKIVAGTGTLTVSAAALNPGSNLRYRMDLLDPSGVVIGSSEGLAALPASITANIVTGYYFIRIDGIGHGTPDTGYSDYGSLGAYSIAGSMPNPDGNFPPLANAVASTTQGDAPLAISFDASASVDSDGSIVSYQWDFGDGHSASGVTASNTYTNAGNYTATLTVTDNQGASGSSALQITVLTPNSPPTAAISVSAQSGTAPLTVNFSAAGSSDSDGSIASYLWDFGDASSTTTTTNATSHTYTSAGSFLATLTVTDNRGATASAVTRIDVVSNPANQLQVASIVLSKIAQKNGSYKVQATVTVTNKLGAVVSGVKVTGQFRGALGGSVSANTTTSGVAALTSKQSARSGTVTITVTGLSKSGYSFDGSQSSSSITL